MCFAPFRLCGKNTKDQLEDQEKELLRFSKEGDSRYDRFLDVHGVPVDGRYEHYHAIRSGGKGISELETFPWSLAV